jgi:MoaA/NifB/PqqE/SkfB family radical SAM enzyme
MKLINPEDNTFSHVFIDVTHKCNMECANCYIPNRDIPDIDKEKVFEALSKLPQKTTIRIVGAEPTMRDDLCEIIAKIKELGHRSVLLTNGLKLAHEPYVQQLKDAELGYVYISMNGADEDSVYEEMDGGKWATVKTRALQNIIKNRMPVHTGTIIAKGVNEHTLKRQIDLLAKTALDLGVNFDTDRPYKRATPMVRVKTVGLIGRSMSEDQTIPFDELLEIASSTLGITKEFILKHKSEGNLTHAGGNDSYMIPYQTPAGKIYIRFINWNVNDDGVVDAGNTYRGRLTPEFKIAPFFEHVKENEHGY